MKNMKILAVAEIAMLACAIIPIASMDGGDYEADATTSYGFNLWINYGSGWSASASVDGYDACIAVQNYASSNNVALAIDSATYTTQYGYKYINTSYGDITTLGEKTEAGSDVWTTIYFPASGSAWTVGSDALGYYKPFADYNPNYQTANIALYYGTTTDAENAMSDLPITGLRSVVPTSDIVGNSDYAVSFYIKIDAQALADAEENGMEFTVEGLSNVTLASLEAGQTFTGYGSDLYLALKNALGTNISAVEDVPGEDHGTYITNYSWMNSLFGLGTVLVDNKGDEDWSNDVYAWWTQYTVYTDDSNDENDVKSDFVMGYYSPLSNAPNVMTAYTLVYSEGTV